MNGRKCGGGVGEVVGEQSVVKLGTRGWRAGENGTIGNLIFCLIWENLIWTVFMVVRMD